jgi:hypothetical protein
MPQSQAGGSSNSGLGATCGRAPGRQEAVEAAIAAAIKSQNKLHQVLRYKSLDLIGRDFAAHEGAPNVQRRELLASIQQNAVGAAGLSPNLDTLLAFFEGVAEFSQFIDNTLPRDRARFVAGFHTERRISREKFLEA